MRISSDPLSDILKFPPIPNEDTTKKDTDLKIMKEKDFKDLNPRPAFIKGNFRKNTQYVKDGPIPTPDSFYFRLNENNFYYSETKEDSVILGAIEI